MPPTEPTRLTDDLWLAAHDGHKGARLVGDRLLGIGLATGLLAELVCTGFLELREGELFRKNAELPEDPALRPVLIKMEAEEQTWPPPAPPARVRAAVRARDDFDWPPQAPDGRQWPPAAPLDKRHRRRGHDLKVWMAYLADEERAEQRVIERLTRAGLVCRKERRRLFGSTTVQYVPYDGNITGRPANMITSAVRGRLVLSRQALLLTGLLLATGLHHHALVILSPEERSRLAEQLKWGLDDQSWELLRAADAAVGETAMR